MELPELKIEDITVQATNRKLKATWSYEYDQKLANDELVEALTRDLLTEIDAEILRDLRNNATKKKTPSTRQSVDGWSLPGSNNMPKMPKKKAPKYRDITEPWEPSMGD